MSKNRSLQALTKLLTENARNQKIQAKILPYKYTTMTAKELYEQFLLVSIDFKGHMVSGFGSSGWQINASASFDPGAFILPGLVSVKAGLKFSGSSSIYVLLAIHRAAPMKIASPSIRVGSIGKLNLWETDKPINLLSFVGISKTFATTGGITISFGISAPADWSRKDTSKETSFFAAPLAIGLIASAAIQKEYQILQLVEENPGAYGNIKDETLLGDFELFIKRNKSSFKRQVIKLLGMLQKEFGNSADIAKQARYFLGRLKTRLQTTEEIYSENPVLNYLEKKAIKELDKNGFSEDIRNILGVVALKVKTPSTEYLIKKVEAIKKVVELMSSEGYINKTGLDLTFEQIKTLKTQMPDVLSALSSNLELTKKRLEDNKKAEDNKGKTNPIPIKKGNISTNDVDANLSYVYALSSASSKGVGATLSAPNAEAGIAKSWYVKNSFYRYQVFSYSSKGKLIYTQDTQIDYRQITLNMAVSVKEKDLKKKKTSGNTINALTYTSACVYWFYPLSESINEGKVKAQLGSGVSFGVSIPIISLKGIIDSLKSSGDGSVYEDEVKVLAKALCLTSKIMKAFLKDLNLGDLSDDAVVLLESSFTLPVDSEISIKVTNPNKNETKVLKLNALFSTDTGNKDGILNAHIESLRSNPEKNEVDAIEYLDSLRVRCRLVDVDTPDAGGPSSDNKKSTTYFKLGITVGVASAGIEIAKISDAGQAGVMDLYAVNFGYSESLKNNGTSSSSPPKASDPKDEDTGNDENVQESAEGPSQLREEAVPPVVLLYQ